MATIREIFNGDPEDTSGNSIRGGLALIIPGALGFGGAVIESFAHPELGVLPLFITSLVPIVIGAFEMLRQIELIEDKNAEARMGREIKNIQRIGWLHRNIDRKK